MAVNIGPKIGIDGEKEYRKSINDIIQQQKTLKAEMGAISSSWDKNTSNMKKASSQSENLAKQIEAQEKRVSELNKMLDESSKKYGENDSRTLKWKEAVAAATTELNGMKAELRNLPNMVQAFGCSSAVLSGRFHSPRISAIVAASHRRIPFTKLALMYASFASWL